jgi:tetratricopeptide (TPR) repeat protein
MRRSRSSSRPSRLARLLLVALVLLCRPLLAQSPQPTDAADEAFGAHYRRAEDLYEAGRFGDSIQALRAAYAIKPLPRLLLNIGQLHLKLGQAREALEAYEAFLLKEPRLNEEVRATVEEGMARARLLLIPPPPPPPTAPPPAPPSGARPSSPPPPLWRRGWFWGGVGLVAAGAAVGISLGITRPWAGGPAEPQDLEILNYTFRR